MQSRVLSQVPNVKSSNFTNTLPCVCYVTGKTAAFMVPTLERLMYCDTKSQPVTRVLVLAPTRELAIQIYEESRSLAQFTNVTICLSAGTSLSNSGLVECGFCNEPRSC